ncbi:SWIM zinc finger [Allopseudospirillum japonicum]|uniref:SWIM zinc finger n=1 Tax=Allopseudospirillum japonicum TaxID=64971 RepID=A0A1H6RLT2_9GAMM|nr:SWIM zinc finger family protein [Allopseudospirillum japonicum]SEI52575.1 SWIM zinc finger [Allopseudospirillum japonicum]
MNAQVDWSLVQRLAPDAASLNAAKKLLKPKSWPKMGHDAKADLLWGLCQGSGGSPYQTLVYARGESYQCSCPSRKVPCKHALALLGRFIETPEAFTTKDLPDWAETWLQKRLAKQAAKKEITPEDAAAKAKRTAQTQAKRLASAQAACADVHQWINDQLETGIAYFIKNIHARCRRMAARLVDAKATNLAGRIDELPACILEAPTSVRAQVALQELAKIALLCRLGQAASPCAQVRRALISGETRQTLLDSTQTLKIYGRWQVIGEEFSMRTTGVLAQARWLLRTDAPAPLALVVDYHPQTYSAEEIPATFAMELLGEVVFYPDSAPYRAFLGEYQFGAPASLASLSQTQLTQAHANIHESLLQKNIHTPWAQTHALILGAGHIEQQAQASYCWVSQDQQQSLVLSNTHFPAYLVQAPLAAALILHQGQYARCVSFYTQAWGGVACQ